VSEHLSVGYFGPAGTFTEEALLSQPELAEGKLRPYASIPEVLAAVSKGEVSMGFVPLENSIEGTVNVTLDGLVFDHALYIQREVVIDIHLQLMANPGVSLQEITKVLSYPHALAQCQSYLRKNLPEAVQEVANSTGDAARLLAEQPKADVAAIAPRLAAALYGLEIVAENIEDHEDNQTRFVAVSLNSVAPPTGHDKTSIVCFQKADQPGSLYGILGQFAARGINLTKLESRPTKRALGDYCFVIDLDGHLADEMVGDCLAELHASLADVKVLGSYPVAGGDHVQVRAQALRAGAVADEWLDGLRGRINGA